MKAKTTNFDINKMTIKQMKTEYEKMAKRANVRLKEIEKHDLSTPAYSYIEKQAKKEKYGIIYDKSNMPRFTRATAKMTQSELRKAFKNVQDFLNAKTSTVRGFNKSLKKSYDTFIEKEKEINITFDQYKDLWSSEVKEFFERVGGSGDAVEYVAKHLSAGATIDEINNIITSEATLSSYKKVVDTYTKKQKQRKPAGSF